MLANICTLLSERLLGLVDSDREGACRHQCGASGAGRKEGDSWICPPRG